MNEMYRMYRDGYEQREEEAFVKEVPIKSIRIFESYYQVFRSHKSGYP